MKVYLHDGTSKEMTVDSATYGMKIDKVELTFKDFELLNRMVLCNEWAKTMVTRMNPFVK